jgi:hypothetical protein
VAVVLVVTECLVTTAVVAVVLAAIITQDRMVVRAVVLVYAVEEPMDKVAPLTQASPQMDRLAVAELEYYMVEVVQD